MTTISTPNRVRLRLDDLRIKAATLASRRNCESSQKYDGVCTELDPEGQQLAALTEAVEVYFNTGPLSACQEVGIPRSGMRKAMVVKQIDDQYQLSLWVDINNQRTTWAAMMIADALCLGRLTASHALKAAQEQASKADDQLKALEAELKTASGKNAALGTEVGALREDAAKARVDADAQLEKAKADAASAPVAPSVDTGTLQKKLATHKDGAQKAAAALKVRARFVFGVPERGLCNVAFAHTRQAVTTGGVRKA